MIQALLNGISVVMKLDSLHVLSIAEMAFLLTFFFFLNIGHTVLPCVYRYLPVCCFPIFTYNTLVIQRCIFHGKSWEYLAVVFTCGMGIWAFWLQAVWEAVSFLDPCWILHIISLHACFTLGNQYNSIFLPFY